MSKNEKFVLSLLYWLSLKIDGLRWFITCDNRRRYWSWSINQWVYLFQPHKTVKLKINNIVKGSN